MNALVFALAVWWTSNTIAHHAIHRPLFRRRSANQLIAAIVSMLIGIPQALWRDRHLAHHAGVAPRLRLSGDSLLQILLVVALWTILLDRAPMLFATVYVPGYLGGLLLCAVHGHYEHAGGTISHYGRLYNLLLFNDGYHVEHHANPGLPWSRLPERRDPDARASAWPAPLRWIERAADVASAFRRTFALEALEHVVLRSRVLQRFVLRTHERALRDLITLLPPVRRVVIVGGGLFPRTALILRSLIPDAHITIVDSSRPNLDRARGWLDDVTFVHARFRGSDCRSDCGSDSRSDCGSDSRSDCDLVVIPLCFDGDRAAIYGHPPAPAVIVHDWIWRKRAVSRVVSVALLKRVNLVTGV